jgi:DNA-binding SARP family transcriptional activator/tetratricopeptide (TPR) repeat protein
MEHGSSVRLEILGPLQAWHGDLAVNLGPVQQRVVLGVLCLHANRSIGREQLIDAVWGETAPAYAVNLLQKSISGLRRALEPVRSARAKSSLLSWTDAGYLLSLPAGGLDLEVFDRELARGRAARAAGDLATASAALHAGLRLWRGPVLDGLSSPLLTVERERLDERRISALEDRIEVDLALGVEDDLVTELRTLVAQHPLRERLRGLLMRALYRAGRPAEALTAYREAHQYLLAELGVEPTAELQRLHLRILRNDPELTSGPAAARPVTASTVAASTVAPPPTPAQVPHGLHDFTGREAELDRLNALVDNDHAVVIATVTGTAGVGKTALAVQFAHRVSHRFPDGQLYVNLRGFGPRGSAVDPSEALRGFLEALAVPAQHIPARLEELAALYRSRLAGRRMLVVLDNASDTQQVQPLLPGSAGCLVVVTSRRRLPGLVAAGAVPVPVDLLTADESRDLLRRRIGEDRVAATPAAVNDLVAACARLPLALAIVAARAAVYPEHSLTALAGELRQARGGLDAFVGEDPASDARAVLSWSYHLLSPEAARLFRLLGVHPGPNLAAPAAASLAGLPQSAVRRLLAELAGAQMLEERTPGRFAFHDLLRAYANEQFLEVETATERHAAIGRVLEHYLYTAHAADRRLYPYRVRVELGTPDPATTVLDFADQGGALTWFMTEHPVLLAAIDLAAEHGFAVHASKLTWAITAFLNYQGKWHDWAVCLRVALDACHRLGDRPGEALAHRLLNLAYLQQGLLDEGDAHAKLAEDLFGELGDASGQGRLHLDYSRVLERRNEYPEALERSRLALELYRSAGDRAGEADALNWVGWFLSRLGRHEEALTYCQQSLDLHRILGDWPTQADTWDALGYVHHHLGHYDDAIASYEQALALWRDLGDRYEVATTLVRLGDSLHAAGDLDSARRIWQQAGIILDELGHPQAAQVRNRLDPHQPVL